MSLAFSPAVCWLFFATLKLVGLGPVDVYLYNHQTEYLNEVSSAGLGYKEWVIECDNGWAITSAPRISIVYSKDDDFISSFNQGDGASTGTFNEAKKIKGDFYYTYQRDGGCGSGSSQSDKVR